MTVTHHGPIVSEALGASEPIALSWTGLQHPRSPTPATGSSTARSGQDVMDAVESHHVPPLNLLWADREATSATSCAGKIPLRKGDVPTCPSRAGPASSSGTGAFPTTTFRAS